MVNVTQWNIALGYRQLYIQLSHVHQKQLAYNIISVTQQLHCYILWLYSKHFSQRNYNFISQKIYACRCMHASSSVPPKFRSKNFFVCVWYLFNDRRVSRFSRIANRKKIQRKHCRNESCHYYCNVTLQQQLTQVNHILIWSYIISIHGGYAEIISIHGGYAERQFWCTGNKIKKRHTIKPYFIWALIKPYFI